MHTIPTSLHAALPGTQAQRHALLGQRRPVRANRSGHRHDIETALDGLNSLSATLAARDRQIGHVLTDLTPGLRVLADQRSALVDMLDSLHRLTGVAVNTIHASQANFVNDLRSLAPILPRLADAGQSLPLALQVLLTYPFTKPVLNGVQVDYIHTDQSLRAGKGNTVLP